MTRLRVAAAFPFALTAALCDLALDRLVGPRDPLDYHSRTWPPSNDDIDRLPTTNDAL